MSCVNCFDGCGTPISDECVKYTGPSIPLLGIETGDPLSKLEAEIVEKLAEFAQGEGIVLSSIDLKCTFIEDILGSCKDKTLINLIQALIDANCTLKQLLDALAEKVNPSYTFNVSCLTGLPADPTRDDILQALINNYCATKATVDIIFGDYVKATDLDTLIAMYLAGASGSVQNYTKMVPYVAYEYYGSLANFDGAGKGLAASGFDKVYLCNGQNGTPDKRGRVAVSVTTVPGGGAFDPAVDPTIPANAGTNYVLNQKFGSSYITLNINQMPAHTHTATVSETPHKHYISNDSGLNSALTGSNYAQKQAALGNNSSYDLRGTSSTANIGLTSGSTTGVTVSNASAGLNQSHDNRQPSIAAYYIMYIP